MTNIKTYSGQKANFYIQSGGLHSGRPLKGPITNCFAIDTDVENAFEIVHALYKSNSFRGLQKGSLIPFISIKEVKSLVIPVLVNSGSIDPAKLKALKACEKMIDNLKAQIIKYTDLESIIASQAIKGI